MSQSQNGRRNKHWLVAFLLGLAREEIWALPFLITALIVQSSRAPKGAIARSKQSQRAD
jgi:hypothetical protein